MDRGTVPHERRNVLPKHEVEQRLAVKLLPCPFCGSDSTGMPVSSVAQVSCLSCNAEGPAVSGKTPDDREQARFLAAQLWNKRAPGFAS